jgi:exopolysaccharide biosynthesis polyprenyl glycosylphosphotransferase
VHEAPATAQGEGKGHWMSEQTASSGLTASTRALGLTPRSLTAGRAPDGLFALARLSVDVASLACAALAIAAWAAQPLPTTIMVVIAVATISGFAAAGLYVPTARPQPLADLRLVLMIPAVITMAAAALELALGRQGVGDAAVRFWLLTATLAGASRVSLLGVEQVVRRHVTRTHGATLIVGAGRVGHLVAQRLLDDQGLGLRPVGFLDKEPMAGDEELRDLPQVGLPVLGASWDLEQVVEAHGIEHVLVAFSTAPNHVVLDMVRRCWKLGVSVMVVPRLYEVEGTRTRTEHLGSVPLVTLSPSDPMSWKFQAKYGLDRLVAAVCLLLMSPLLAVIALAILITSGRPIFFRQQRVGRDGHAFEMLKFRTMSGAPEQGGQWNAAWASAMASGALLADGAPDAGGDRRTRLGSFLRRMSLDELPQLWNVMRGDMSIVGPRPEQLAYVELFERAIYRYPDRHRVKSGLTGWAQINGLRGDTSLSDRIEWDNFYIENWSPWLDFRILMRTVPALFTGRGAQ